MWDFVAGAKDIHVIFGWLQVGEKLHIGDSPSRDSYPSWLEDHPHIQNAKDCPIKNTVYVASRNLVVNGEMLQRHGGGVSPNYSVARQLTHPHGLGRSTWLLPDWFNPFLASRRPSLTYHPNRTSWGALGDAAGHVTLKAAHIGQEFVLDTASYPEALPWLKGLFDWHK